MTAVKWERLAREQRAARHRLPGIMPLCSTVMLGASGVRCGALGHGVRWI